MALTKEKIEELKKKLLSDKNEIEKDLERLKEDLDFGEANEDAEEETDESEEHGNYLAIKKPLEEKLNAIEIALKKIGSHKYGKCEKCRSAIEEKVLGAAPESFLCKKCKSGR